MRDALDIYFLNQVVKIAELKVAFSWSEIVDKIISTYKLPFDGGKSIEAHIYAYRSHGTDFKRQLNTLLADDYIAIAKNEQDKYILTKKAREARKFENIEEYEKASSPSENQDNEIDYKKFDRKLISFLKKQPQNFGNISPIVNTFIDKKQDNRNLLHRQLVHLSRDRDIIEIRDEPEDDPYQMQSDWWGNFKYVNINRGDKVEGLLAKLSKGYLKISWWDRNRTKAELIKILLPVLLSFLLGLITCKVYRDKKQAVLTPNESIYKQSAQTKYVDATNDDSLLHKKDILKGIKTK